MIHINDGHGLALCKNTDGSVVVAALESDCTECRELQMISPVNEKGCEVRKTPDWEQKPLPDADELLADVMKRRW